MPDTEERTEDIEERVKEVTKKQSIRADHLKSREILQNTRIIAEDMRKNRKEYSSMDLSWRNVDLFIALLQSMEALDIVVASLIKGYRNLSTKINVMRKLPIKELKNAESYHKGKVEKTEIIEEDVEKQKKG